MTLAVRNALIALALSTLMVGTVALGISYLNRQRVEDLTAMEAQLSVDTLSLDTQFSLLEAAPCDSAASSTVLTGELSDLGDKLSYAEDQLGATNAQVLRLKKQYSLLEIRDYLITKQLAAACGTHPVTVLYFYSNAGDCADCDKAGYALSYLRNTYPNLRVYSFDYRLDLGALKTLLSINKITATELPTFVINNKEYDGFTSLEALQKEFPKGSLSTTTPSTK